MQIALRFSVSHMQRLAAFVFSVGVIANLLTSSVAFAQAASTINSNSNPQSSSKISESVAPSVAPPVAPSTPPLEATPAPTPTGKMPTHAEDVTIPPLPNAWSFLVYLQGVESGSGLGVGVETPKAWGILNGRFSVISDRFRDRTAANQDLEFVTAQAAVKVYLVPRASNGIGSYVLAGYNHHFVSETTDGSKDGLEVLYGIEFNQFVADNKMSRIAVQGAFVELGTTYAGVTNSPGGVRLRDGAIVRLGFKTYF